MGDRRERQRAMEEELRGQVVTLQRMVREQRERLAAVEAVVGQYLGPPCLDAEDADIGGRLRRAIRVAVAAGRIPE